MGMFNLSLPQRRTQRQRDERVKEMALESTPPGGVLYEVSDEQRTYEEEAAWRISEQTAQVREDGSAQVEARLEEEVQRDRAE
eukprot:4284735-Alexandrium_andersonii.AAC.1